MPENSLVVTAPGAVGASVLGLSTTQGQSAAKARHPAFQARGASNDDQKRCGRGHNLGLDRLRSLDHHIHRLGFSLNLGLGAHDRVERADEVARVQPGGDGTRCSRSVVLGFITTSTCIGDSLSSSPRGSQRQRLDSLLSRPEGPATPTRRDAAEDTTSVSTRILVLTGLPENSLVSTTVARGSGTRYSRHERRKVYSTTCVMLASER